MTDERKEIKCAECGTTIGKNDVRCNVEMDDDSTKTLCGACGLALYNALNEGGHLEHAEITATILRRDSEEVSDAHA